MAAAANPNDLINIIYLIWKGASTAIIPKEEITLWADSFIEKDDKPDIFFIELSMCHTLNDIVSHINDFFFFNSINTDITISPRPLFSYYYKYFLKSQLKEWEVTNFLYQFDSDKHFSLTEIEAKHIYLMDDPYYSFRSDNTFVVTEEFIFEYVFKFLDNYKDYSLHNYQDWSKIDKQVDSCLFEFDKEMDTIIQEFIAKKTVNPATATAKRPW